MLWRDQRRKAGLLQPNSNFGRSQRKRGAYGPATCDSARLAGVEGVTGEETTPIFEIGKEPQKIFTKARSLRALCSKNVPTARAESPYMAVKPCPRIPGSTSRYAQ
jgi:hypothetical protein